MNMHGKASSQKNREDQLSVQILELEQEIASRKKAEERIAALTEELKACQSQLALSDENIEERIRLDALLLEISAHFINLPSDQIDKAIEDAQRRVCECLEIDMCTLWQSAAENPDEMVLTHMYRSFDGPAVPSRMAASQNFPWSFQQALAGKTYVVPSIENVPAEAASQVPTWRYYGIKAVVGIPLITGSGRPFGVITFQDMRAARAWSEMLINRLQLVAQVFTSALIRKQIDSALRESEARLSMITEAVGAGLWVMEVDTKKIWVSPKSRELFHFSPDEEICYESYFRVIHPDDHERVNEYVRQTLQFGENRLCDYRIILPDGTIRWITSRAQRNCKSAGEPERLVGLSVDITDRKQMENQLREQLQKIEDFKQRLENENLYLQKEIQFLGEHMQIVGQSLAIKQILSDAHMVAQTDSTVLILGETGTGKELLARAIHQLSTRKGRAMVTINCAALPPTLIESELFGREKGAYTGALTKMPGRFEIADGSTLFLDEIGELPIELQGKLLRVLEEGVFERLGSTKPLRVNVRIIAATNRDLEHEVAQGKFRRDLFYRLNVFPIVMPPLRQRPQDIPLLVWAFVREFQKRMGKEIETISKKTMEALQAYAWPGNIRELKNVIEHSMILSSHSKLIVTLPQFESSRKKETQQLEDIERMHITSVLKSTGWQVGGKGGASEILGLKRSTLYSKMKKLGIVRTEF